jgi:hypothetical protein
MAERANTAFGLDAVIHGIELADHGPGRRLRFILDEHYSWAWHEVGKASSAGLKWIGWLADAWQQVLPGTRFPSHESRAIEAALGYNTSPERESFKEILFGIDQGTWALSERTDDLILDNDIRALVYEGFAQSLDTALSDAPGRPSIVYVGGCLRSPMLFARARWADECLKETTQPEAFLQRAWRDHWTGDRRGVRLPFWMTAVIGSARSISEVADRARTLRRSTKRARRRRAELCESLRRGEPAANRALFQALAADLEGLTADWENAAGAVLDVGTTALEAAAPGVPTELLSPALKAATVMGDGWLRTIALRLFRPRVYAIYRMAVDAGQLTDILGASSRLFQFETAYASQPVDFMRRLGKVAWVA